MSCRIYLLLKKLYAQMTNLVNMVDGWMNDVRFTSFSTVFQSGRWANDYERLCAMELRLRLDIFFSRAGLELRTARSVGLRVNMVNDILKLVILKG